MTWREERCRDGNTDKGGGVAAEDGEGDAGARGDGDEDADQKGAVVPAAQHLLG